MTAPIENAKVADKDADDAEIVADDVVKAHRLLRNFRVVSAVCGAIVVASVVAVVVDVALVARADANADVVRAVAYDHALEALSGAHVGRGDVRVVETSEAIVLVEGRQIVAGGMKH